MELLAWTGGWNTLIGQAWATCLPLKLEVGAGIYPPPTPHPNHGLSVGEDLSLKEKGAPLPEQGVESDQAVTTDAPFKAHS